MPKISEISNNVKFKNIAMQEIGQHKKNKTARQINLHKPTNPKRVIRSLNGILLKIFF